MAAFRWLGALVVASLALHLRAEYFGPAWQVYLFKPLTTSLVIAAAAVWPGRVPPPYRALIVAGLVCSLGGDVFLMLPGDWFVAGLASFLVAHLCYLGAFTASSGWRVTPWFLAVYALYGAVLLIILWPSLGRLWAPVLLYACVLTMMGWRTAERWVVWRTTPAAGAAFGGVLFMVSDSVLAVNRFIEPFRASRLVIMTTYVAAQWLIARSVADRPPAVGSTLRTCVGSDREESGRARPDPANGHLSPAADAAAEAAPGDHAHEG